MKIIFTENLPVNRGGYYAHYKHRLIGDNAWKYCDIRKYIGQNQDEWLEEIDCWHSELSREAIPVLPFWWFMSASRLAAIYPQQASILNPFFFAIAVVEYCDAHKIEEIYLVQCPSDVKDYLRERGSGLDIFVSESQRLVKDKNINVLSIWINSFKNALRQHLINIKEFLKLILHSFSFSKVNKAGMDKIKLIILSIFLDDKKNKRDHFFGKMFDDVSCLKKEDILWVYPSLDKKNINQYLKTKGYPYIALYKLLTIIDVLNILRICILINFKMKLLEKKLPALKIVNYHSSIFPEKFFNNLINNALPIIGLGHFFSLKRLLQITNPETIIYPYEEQGFERAIIAACKQSKKEIRTVGYAHAVYSQGHLYLRNRPSSMINSPKPDLFAAAGPGIKDFFVNWADVDSNKVIVIGSDRFRELIPIINNHKIRNERLKVLVLSGQSYELDMLANYLEEDKNLFDGCEILIRKYPHSWSEEQEAGAVRIKKFAPNLKEEEGLLEDQFYWCDVAIFSSTSAGIEAMLSGRPSIYIELHDCIDLNPFVEKGDLSSIMRCSSTSHLRDALNKFRSMNDKEYEEYAQKQRKFASSLFSPVNQDNLRRLVLND